MKSKAAKTLSLALVLGLCLVTASTSVRASQVPLPPLFGGDREEQFTQGQLDKIFDAVRKQGRRNLKGGRTLVVSGIDLGLARHLDQTAKARVALSNSALTKGKELVVRVSVVVRENPLASAQAPTLLRNARLRVSVVSGVTRAGIISSFRAGLTLTGDFVVGALGLALNSKGDAELRANREWQSNAAEPMREVLAAVSKALSSKVARVAARVARAR